MEYCDEICQQVPAGWEVKNLYGLADFINGLACQKYRPQHEEDFLPVIKIAEMHEGITPATEKVSVNIPENRKIKDGDILFSWSATLETMFWYGGNAALNQHIFKVVPKEKCYFYTYMHLNAYINNLRRIAESRKTTMGHITTDHLKQARIVIPPKSLMEKYDATVASLFEQIKMNNAENRYLMNTEKKLCPLILNGQVSYKPCIKK